MANEDSDSMGKLMFETIIYDRFFWYGIMIFIGLVTVIIVFKKK